MKISMNSSRDGKLFAIYFYDGINGRNDILKVIEFDAGKTIQELTLSGSCIDSLCRLSDHVASLRLGNKDDESDSA